MLSRGLRNCNPGNIRLSTSPFRGEITPSEDPLFKQFETIGWGYRAMFLIIDNYRILYGIDTLDRIISRWAPPIENETSSYIKAVAKRLGCSTCSYIDSRDEQTMMTLVGAMSWIENGTPAKREDLEAGWELFERGLST